MRRMLVFAPLLLTACPPTWGFVGRVLAENGTMEAIAVTRSGDASSEALAPIAGARVTCDGCAAPIEVDATGRFLVSLGTSYSTPGPIVLHVTAPGHAPIDVEIPRTPVGSQAGPALVLIVLRPPR